MLRYPSDILYVRWLYKIINEDGLCCYFPIGLVNHNNLYVLEMLNTLHFFCPFLVAQFGGFCAE